MSHVNYSFAAVNSLLAVSAFFGNIIILSALKKESSFHPPTKLLYRTLAFTDLFVGLIVQPTSVVNNVSKASEKWKLCYQTGLVGYVVGVILCGVSLSVLTAISMDRLLALTLRLRYRQVVTLKRVQAFVILSCLQNTINSFLPLWNTHVFVVVCWALILLCLAVSTFCYLKIFLVLRRLRIQVQVQHNLHWAQPSGAGSTGMNMPRYMKSVSAALWVHLALLACYTPFTVVTVRSSLPSGMVTDATTTVVRSIAITLVYFNSSLNPVLYCWRVTEVRQIVKNMLRKFFCKSS